VHREYLLVDDGSDRQAVETVGEGLPQFDVVPAFTWAEASYQLIWKDYQGTRIKERTFVIKAIYPVDACAFMVPSQDEEVFRVFDLVREEQTDRLEGLFTSVYVVAKEKVICFWREAAVFEESEEVVILTVNVTLSNRVNH
jgi:hypothetical protein